MSLYEATAMLNNEIYGDSSMIRLFSKPNCSFCEQAKHYLNNLKIEFDVVDITKDPMAHSFLVKEGHKTVPQFYHNNDLLFEGGYTELVKYSKEQINEIIGDTTNVNQYRSEI